MNTENFLIEFPELSYDRVKLLGVFEKAKPYARVKGLPWREYSRGSVNPVDTAKCVVIQAGEHQMLDPTKSHLSYNLLDDPYVKELVSVLKFDHEILAGHVDIIWYRPGFVFEPHTDGYAYSTMMFPIFPADGGAPIDFYHRDDIVLEKGKAGSFKNLVTPKDIAHTHYYKTSYPTIFNSHVIHGVREVKEERAYLRLRVNEYFESILEKYKKNELW